MNGMTADALYVSLSRDLAPWIHESGPSEPVSSFAARALKDNLFKKLNTEVSPDADSKALTKFLQINETVGSWKLEVSTLEDELLLGELRACLYNFFNQYRSGHTMNIVSDYHEIASHGTLGPGKSVGSVHENFYSKLFDSELTATSSGLHRIYANYISQHPLWSEAESIRLARRGEGKVVRGNRLTFVPKTNDISRTICIEPVLNMFFQQGIRYILEDRLRQFFGIDVSTQQDKNRMLAKIGSERSLSDRRGGDDTTGLVTIDLSSASDSLGLEMLRSILDRTTYDSLTFCRSPYCELPNKEVLALNMISTMGNAFTFPLETILFSSVVFSAARVCGLSAAPQGSLRGTFLVSPHGERLGNFGVFGDDIIVPAVIAGKVLRLLKLLGFQVNAEKTFLEGPFRESCGADFYRGHDVRPVFCKKLELHQDSYSLINRLNQWSFEKGIPLRETVGTLLRYVPRYEVPPWESDECGIKIPLARWLTCKPKKRMGSYLYKRWVPNPPKVRIDTDKQMIFVPRGKKPIFYNEAGLYLAFLRGVIVNGSISVRHNRVRYTTKVGVAPNWECNPTMKNPFKGSFGGPDLERLAKITF